MPSQTPEEAQVSAFLPSQTPEEAQVFEALVAKSWHAQAWARAAASAAAQAAEALVAKSWHAQAAARAVASAAAALAAGLPLALERESKKKRKKRDEGLLEATRMAQEVRNLLLDGGNFKLCLASLTAANHGQRWISVLRAAKFLLDQKIFCVDMEGHYDTDAWELAIVIHDVR